MIYFDNSATTLVKPKEVGEAIKYAVDNFGNPSRSVNECALLAAREVYQTRVQLAKLVNLNNPLRIAFTSGATESLNLIINGLINYEDHVITTILEHNSVLRPLYNSGCSLSFVKMDIDGNIIYDDLSKIVKENTKALVCTHASNVTGKIIDVDKIASFCKQHGIIFILDVSQTLGSIPVYANMADIMCFTGHKSLFGPQGTGGIIMEHDMPIRITKTGGAGSNSFALLHSSEMPDIFEVGTPNSHGIYGLQQGVKFINNISIEKIKKHKDDLVNVFLNGLDNINGLKVYSDRENVGVIALNFEELSSADFAQRLYEDYEIATRAQSHCAPLLHEFYETEKQGMVRFSFSYFNTINEVEECINAIKNIVIIERKKINE